MTLYIPKTSRESFHPSPLWGRDERSSLLGGRPTAGRVGGCFRKRDFCGRSGGGRLANENARALRKRLTPQEVKLWVKLRELKALDFHFRRQAPIGQYIADFVSFRAQLIIEADGGQHGMLEGARSDQVRDAFLQSQGFRVLRFWNSEIDANLAGVMNSILSALKHPHPTGLRPATQERAALVSTPQGGGIRKINSATAPRASRR